MRDNHRGIREALKLVEANPQAGKDWMMAIPYKEVKALLADLDRERRKENLKT